VQLLTKALQGELGRMWCLSSDHDYETIREKLIRRIEMECGMALGTDLDAHIANFKDMVYIRGLNLESEEVKG